MPVHHAKKLIRRWINRADITLKFECKVINKATKLWEINKCFSRKYISLIWNRGFSFFFFILVIHFHQFGAESSWVFFHLESQLFFFKSHNKLLRVELIFQAVVHGIHQQRSRTGWPTGCWIENLENTSKHPRRQNFRVSHDDKSWEGKAGLIASILPFLIF